MKVNRSRKIRIPGKILDFSRTPDFRALTIFSLLIFDLTFIERKFSHNLNRSSKFEDASRISLQGERWQQN